MCKCTKVTRAGCGRNSHGHVLLATKFGDIITADHKIPNEEGESRNSQRYSLVVQDLATQWIQSCPCRTKTSQETVRNPRTCLDHAENPKVICTDNSFESRKVCEDLQWNHCASTENKRNCSKSAVRRVQKEALHLFYCSPDSMKSGGQNVWNAVAIDAIFIRYESPYERRFEEQLSGTNHTIRKSRISFNISEKPGDAPSTWQERILRSSCPMLFMGQKLERRLTRSRRWGSTGERRIRCAFNVNNKLKKKFLCRKKETNSYAQLLTVPPSWLEEVLKSEHPTEFGKVPKRRRTLQWSSRRNGWTRFVEDRDDWKQNVISGSYLEASVIIIMFKKNKNVGATGMLVSNSTQIYWRCQADPHVYELQECRMGDYWNVDGGRILSGHWTGVIQTPLRGNTRVGGIMGNIRATWRPEHTWPQIWSGLSKKSQQWKNTTGQKKSQSSTLLEGWEDFFDPEDMELNETLQNERKKLEVHLDSAIPCRVRKTSETSSFEGVNDLQQEIRDENWQGVIFWKHHHKKIGQHVFACCCEDELLRKIRKIPLPKGES